MSKGKGEQSGRNSGMSQAQSSQYKTNRSSAGFLKGKVPPVLEDNESQLDDIESVKEKTPEELTQMYIADC